MNSQNNPDIVAITNSVITPSIDKENIILLDDQETYFINHINIFTDEFKSLHEKVIQTCKRRKLIELLVFFGLIIGFILFDRWSGENLSLIFRNYSAIGY